MTTLWDWLVFLVGVGSGVMGTLLAIRFGCAERCPRRAASDDGRAARSTRSKIEMPPLKDRELRAALLVGDEHPMWRAVHQCIDVLEARATSEAIDADNATKPPLPAYYSGAAAHLQQLRGFILEQRELAKSNVDDDD